MIYSVMLEGAKSIGAGAATIASAGAAVGIGNVFSSSIHSVARNPSLAKQLFGLCSNRSYRLVCSNDGLVLAYLAWEKLPLVPRLLIGIFLIPLIYRFLLKELMMTGGDSIMDAVTPFLRRSSGGMQGLPGPFGGGGPEIIPVQPPEQPENEGAAPADAPPEGGFNLEPLISKEQRLEELRAELRHLINEGIVEKATYSDSLIKKQFEFELKLEGALRREGYTDASILSCRAGCRRAALYTDTSPAPLLARSLSLTMRNHPDITTTLHYRRILRGIQFGSIPLQKNL